MSDCSSSSYESKKRYLCGLIARHFMAYTSENAGRRFFKCPKPKKKSCGYWEWQDDVLPPRVVILISSPKRKLEAAKMQRDILKKKMADYDIAAGVKAQAIAKLSEKVVERNILKKKLVDAEFATAIDVGNIATLSKTVAHQWMLIRVLCG
ncbi:PREDICTED: uncharacterized protein LOC109224668 [Nicotiana attenuata]|uniref:uncharacterized protein LOC109224668 n=1 Tax=Nicotiana attenuata TaxID=49451 RepID=UPI000905AEBF|nr:PREDICTED: uncharacterized protein LOC109224668 [Nicotiana attenuata]